MVAAFAEAGIEARGSTRGNEALMLAASFRPDVVVVDLVRPGSEGRWLLGRLCAQNDEVPVGPLPRAVLALAPVTGDYSDLPDGVEVVVKPIFPSQVVASARRLLGPLAGHALRSGPVSAATPSRPFGTPVSASAPSLSGRPARSDQPAIEHTLPPSAGPLDPFDDDSDFGPADTLLAPAASISELARSMALIPDSSPRAPVRPREVPAAPAAAETTTGEATMPLVEFNLRSDVSGSVELTTQSSSGEATTATPRLVQSGLGLSPSEANREALVGSLAAVPLIDVLSMLARQCQTGVLRVVTTSTQAPNGRRFELVLRRGQLEQVVASGLPTLRLGRFVLELETLRQPELDAVAAARGKRSRTNLEIVDGELGVPMDTEMLLGSRLVAAGMLTSDELRQVLQRQSIELLYEALRLPSGRFVFARTHELPRWAIEPALGAGLGLDIEALLLEGARRADEWYQLDLDTSEAAVYVSTVSAQQDVHKLGLSSAESAVLVLCNGRHSVGEIAKQSRLALLDVARTLGRLQSLRLCRRRLPAVLAS